MLDFLIFKPLEEELVVSASMVPLVDHLKALIASLTPVIILAEEPSLMLTLVLKLLPVLPRVVRLLQVILVLLTALILPLGALPSVLLSALVDVWEEVNALMENANVKVDLKVKTVVSMLKHKEIGNHKFGEKVVTA